MRKCLKKKNKYRSFLEKCITGKSMKALISLLILSLCMQGNIALAGENVGLIQENDLTAQEEKAADTVDEIQEPTDLYAQSAVLMDAESGRVLFAKEGNNKCDENQYNKYGSHSQQGIQSCFCQNLTK